MTKRMADSGPQTPMMSLSWVSLAVVVVIGRGDDDHFAVRLLQGHGHVIAAHALHPAHLGSEDIREFLLECLQSACAPIAA